VSVFQASYAPSLKAIRAVRRYLDRTHLYLDGGSYYLVKRLSELTGFPTNQIAVGSGTTELILIPIQKSNRQNRL
jgi:histidinol-phosphate/aromatic aminotransferase/cobyric acid decarboxylase-like protein